MPKKPRRLFSSQAIEQRALALLQEHDLAHQDKPVDVEELARRLDIRVEKADLGTDTSAVIVTRDDGTAVIGVNWEHHPNRQRFSIAHELGHHQLHTGGTFVDKGIYARFRDPESTSGSNKEEREANQFAAALLMPRASVQKAFEEHSLDLGEDLSELEPLAKRFGVSVQALTIRLASLKLLDF